MLDINANQREATRQWYAAWLEQRFTEPVFENGTAVRYECSLSKEEIEEMALQFATEQNPLPVVPPDESEEEKLAREADEEKLATLRRKAYAYTAREMHDDGPRRVE